MSSAGALPKQNQRFSMTFDNGMSASAVRVEPDSDPIQAMRVLGFDRPYPCIFISGGASNMTEEDRQRIRDIMAVVAAFAQQKGAVIVDGGTEAGVMQMIADARLHGGHTFPLVGVSPLGKVSFPGYKNPNEEAYLEDSHTHFVLVEGDNWGAETKFIIRLTNRMGGGGKLPTLGILINGGAVAMEEIYLASTSEMKFPIIVVEGSGRAADEISTAFRTGRTNRAILKAILAGGDLSLVPTIEGTNGIREKLIEKFV